MKVRLILGLIKRGCIYTLNELLQGRLREGKDTYAFTRAASSSHANSTCLCHVL